MSHSLTFEILHQYDSGKEGISIPVALKVGTSETSFEAKLDTGASFCIFERIYGEELGFDVETGDRLVFNTPTGAFVAYGHNVTLSILGYDFDATVFFAENENFHRNVIGRNGWLNRVQIAIVDYEGKLYLNLYRGV
jgi:hypothetical protein